MSMTVRDLRTGQRHTALPSQFQAHLIASHLSYWLRLPYGAS